jgi:hypothetical protein
VTLRELAAVAVAYAVLAFTGALVRLLLPAPRNACPAASVAEAFLLGCGAVSLGVFVVAALDHGLFGAWAGFAPAALLLAFELARRRVRGTGGVATTPRRISLTWPAAVVLGALVLNHAAYALGSDLDWDGKYVWEIKARLVVGSGGIPAWFWAPGSHGFCHIDYPWLVPALEAWVYALAGTFSVVAVKAVLVGFFASLLVLVHQACAEIVPALASLALTVTVGLLPTVARWSAGAYADPVIATYWFASVAWSVRAILAPERGRLVLATTFAVLAAWTKREGLIHYLPLHTVALLAIGPRGWPHWRARLLFLAGASALVLGPWLLVLRSSGTIPTSDFSVSLGRLVANAGRIPELGSLAARELLDREHWGFFWVAVLAALASLPFARTRHAASFPLGAAVVVSAVVWALVFALSIWTSFRHHFETAYERLLLQIVPVAALLVAAAGAGLAPAPESGEPPSPAE